MLRWQENPAFQTSLVQELRSSVLQGRRIVVAGKPGSGRSRTLAKVAAGLPNAILVRISPALDQAERVILEIADALGNDARQDIDRELRDEPGDLNATLTTLERHLARRPVLVDDIDRVGVFATDREVGLALEKRTQGLQSWLLKRAALATAWKPPQGLVRKRIDVDVDDQPSNLVNGSVIPSRDLWGDLLPDVRAFELVLSWCAVGQSPHPPETYEADQLRKEIVERLPHFHQRALCALSLHGRAMAVETLLAAVDADQAAPLNALVATGESMGIWTRTEHGIVSDGEWGKWYERYLGDEERAQCHHQLGNAFAMEVDPSDVDAWRRPLAVLEAHRHFALSGDERRARDFARYGAVLLVEHARIKSLQKQYSSAARIYGLVVQGGENGQFPMSPRLLAYAEHYYHFNRARDRKGTLREARDGYRHSLQRWPENALFWSRLIRVCFYLEEPGEALVELARAQDVVPEHPEKNAVLIARTVRGLLRNNRVEDAMFVWRDFQPTFPGELDAEMRLKTRLSQGWRTDRLSYLGTAPVILTEKIEISLEQSKSGWRCVMESLNIRGAGATPADAYEAAVERLREEVQRLLAAYTHELEEDEIRFKRLLLSVVDVIASRLDPDGPETTWVFGDLVREKDQRLWLKTGGTFDLKFEIPEHLSRDLVLDRRPHFARVKAGRAGEPIGPVLQIETPLPVSDRELWQAWQERLTRGE